MLRGSSASKGLIELTMLMLTVIAVVVGVCGCRRRLR